MAGPYRSREGLSTRSAAFGGNSEEFQVRIEPDFDEEVTGLRNQVRRLRDNPRVLVCDGMSTSLYRGKDFFDCMHYLSIMDEHMIVKLTLGGGFRTESRGDVAQDIETEAKFQNDFLNQLQMTLIKAQAGVKNNMRRLNKSIIWEGSNHVLHVVLFALLLFFVVYMFAKLSRR